VASAVSFGPGRVSDVPVSRVAGIGLLFVARGISRLRVAVFRRGGALHADVEEPFERVSFRGQPLERNVFNWGSATKAFLSA